jgi:hypothetical protein
VKKRLSRRGPAGGENDICVCTIFAHTYMWGWDNETYYVLFEKAEQDGPCSKYTLNTSMELSQWNPLVLLMYANKIIFCWFPALQKKISFAFFWARVLLYSPRWPWSSCLSLLSAKITEVHHYARLKKVVFGLTRVWTKGLRQVLYLLSHSSSFSFS